MSSCSTTIKPHPPVVVVVVAEDKTKGGRETEGREEGEEEEEEGEGWEMVSRSRVRNGSVVTVTTAHGKQGKSNHSSRPEEVNVPEDGGGGGGGGKTKDASSEQPLPCGGEQQSSMSDKPQVQDVVVGELGGDSQESQEEEQKHPPKLDLESLDSKREEEDQEESDNGDNVCVCVCVCVLHGCVSVVIVGHVYLFNYSKTLGPGMMLWPCTMVCGHNSTKTKTFLHFSLSLSLRSMQLLRHTEQKCPGQIGVIPLLGDCRKCLGRLDTPSTSTRDSPPPPGRGGRGCFLCVCVCKFLL